MWIGVPAVLAGAGVAAKRLRSSDGGEETAKAGSGETDGQPSQPGSPLKAVGDNPGEDGSGQLDVDAPNESAPGHYPDDASKRSAGGGAS